MNFGMCGRWRNGRLASICTMAGTEECDFECPHRDEPAEIGKRSTSAATASGHELPNGTGAAAPSLPVANGGDARVASAGSPSGVAMRTKAVIRKCRGGRTEHLMEPEWEGRSYAFMKCRWCGKREAV